MTPYALKNQETLDNTVLFVEVSVSYCPQFHRVMLFKFPTYLITCIALALCSCTDPIDFDTEDNGGYLIVEGLVTDAPGTNRVKLSRSAAFTNIFDGGLETSVTSAVVSIADDLGKVSLLTEISGGLYLTDSLDFSGEVGRTYVLNIETTNGKKYTSQPEKLLKSVSFDELSATFKEIEVVNDNNIIVTREGTEILVDLSFLNSRNTFVRHAWRYSIGKRVFFDIDYINVLNGNNFNNNRVNDLSILFVDKVFLSPTQEFRMEVFQYTLSKDVHDFWDAAFGQRNNGGSIFDAPPARITGNMMSTDDPDEIVIGVFSAAGLNKKEIRFIQ